jgi:hypothetical protein
LLKRFSNIFGSNEWEAKWHGKHYKYGRLKKIEVYGRAPKLLDRLKMSIMYKTLERIGVWGTFLDS